MNLRTAITIRYTTGSESSACYDGGDTDNMPRVYRALSSPGVKEVTYLVYVDNKPQYPEHTIKSGDEPTLSALLDKVDAAKSRSILGGDVNACAAYLWGMVAMMEEMFGCKEWWLQNYAIQSADAVARQCNIR